MVPQKERSERNKEKLKQYNSGSSYRITIDIIGQFLIQTFVNIYLMVSADYFSKWQEVVSISN